MKFELILVRAHLGFQSIYTSTVWTRPRYKITVLQKLCCTLQLGYHDIFCRSNPQRLMFEMGLLKNRNIQLPIVY